MSLFKIHGFIEKNALYLLIGTLIVVSIGGLIEIVPLFFVNNTVEKVDGVRPYSPLELAGRNIYIREGCYLCHSQMIRPFRDETERYGHYSLAAESMYDHPFQWGSKRTGPDLARVGGKYTNAWHVAHLTNPRSVVPESVMPRYFFLKNKELKFDNPAAHMVALKDVGVPYTDEDMAKALDDVKAQASGSGDVDGLKARYPKVVIGDFDGNPDRITEMDALVSYLQMLGTLVDFSTYKPEAR